MITRTAGLAAVAALMATPVFADVGGDAEPKEGFYVSAAGGAAWLNDIDIFTGSSYTGETDAGWAAIGAAGYHFGNGFRGELEVGYRQNDGLVFSNFEGVPVADFDVDALDVMANGYYDFRTGSFIEPYVGAGVGMANVNFDFGPGEGEDDAWAFAYQFIGGFNVPLPNSRVSLFADYRYLATEGLDVDFGGEIDHDEYRSHTVLGGIRFTF